MAEPFPPTLSTLAAFPSQSRTAPSPITRPRRRAQQAAAESPASPQLDAISAFQIQSSRGIPVPPQPRTSLTLPAPPTSTSAPSAIPPASPPAPPAAAISPMGVLFFLVHWPTMAALRKPCLLRPPAP